MLNCLQTVKFRRCFRIHTLFAVNSIRCMSSQPLTLSEKIWNSHVVTEEDDKCLLYIDRQLVHEVTSAQAFEGLRVNGRKMRRPENQLSVADHNIPTLNRRKGIKDRESRIQVETLEKNVNEFNLPYIPLLDDRQGIVHIIGPEQGWTYPGMTIVCGDSHTSTHGAFGSLAFGIGTSEVEHVFVTQTVPMTTPKTMRIHVEGALPFGVTSKDLILYIIGQIGTSGGTGHIIEYTGDSIMNLSMESRMTVCNMSIEAGARAGLIAPDETTFNYLKGRPMAPKGKLWDQAVEYWKSLPSDDGATYDNTIIINASEVEPQVTWGTSPQEVTSVNGIIPNLDKSSSPEQKKSIHDALEYMGLESGQKMSDVSINTVFIGSCTNGRIEDLRAVAKVAKDQKVSSNVRALVVPGSGLVKKQAEKEGLADILTKAGFEWREPGCSMCLAMNADRLEPEDRCASTSNRNFVGRQGRGGRTHLVSPATAAASAITGRLTDFRQFNRGFSSQPKINRWSGKMEPFTKLKGIVAPLEKINVDTDCIIPKQFLKTIKRTGLGPFCFHELRYNYDGSEKEDFILNTSAYRSASILVTGDNFGCGSSREHAPWALLDFGISAIVSTSFADIFYNNCGKNGIVCCKVDHTDLSVLMMDAKEEGQTMTVDLENSVIIRSNGETVPFTIDSFMKYKLLNGVDDIALTLKHEDKIKAFEVAQAKEQPWLSA